MATDLRHILPLLIPLVAIIMGVGLAMLSVWTDYNRKREMFEMHHKERLLAIERGLEVPPLPPEFFQSRRNGANDAPAIQVRNGFILVFVGIAVMIALALNRDLESAAWGLVPVAVGLAILLGRAVAARSATPEK